jgi:hypothetical protein
MPMSLPTLNIIRTKVRKLTRSPSQNQLSDAEIDDYINTFILYDMPEQLRLFNLYKTFSFYTEPGIDTYKASTSINSPLYNFKNRIITIHAPIYIAGFKTLLSESREQFYNMYPNISSIASIGQVGDNAQTAFSGTINSQQGNIPGNLTLRVALIRENILFNSVDVNGNGLAMIDYPISPTIGNLYIPGGAPASTSVQDIDNYINYVTGQFVVTFNTAPATGAAINSQTVQVQTALPKTVLFFDGYFTLRPVPDQVYKVTMDVYVQPTELMANSDVPELAEWWQYIAYGSSRKVFQDRMDLESVMQIDPEYKEQEALITRRTIVQMTSQRTATIYSQDNSQIGGFGPNNGNNY